MPDARTVSIRSATADDHPAVTDLLQATLRTDPVLAWLHPHASAHQLAAAAAAAAGQAVAQARAGGAIDIASLGPGRLDGVAVWADHTTPAAIISPMIHPGAGITPDARRAAELGLLLDVEHPLAPHHDLLHLVLGPALAGRAGMVARLLGAHHDRLDAAGLPAYTVVHRHAARNVLLARQWEQAGMPTPTGEVDVTCPATWALRRTPGSRDRAGHEPGA